MTIDEIKKLIQNGEKIDVEFKESRNALTKDVFDTVCSFNNRNGGHILLGVNDKRDIVGVSEDKVDKVIKEFTTSINNSQKMHPPLYLLPEVFEIDSKKVIYIRVPEGYQVCRHNGRIWDRSYEGDINITDHAELVYKLYARKQGSYFVNKVYPNLDIDFLDASVIAKAKRMAVARNKNHVWENMSDEELLRSANLILTDPETKLEGITLAAILLFGKDNSIMSVLPQHKTDAIFRVENKDRYDDRDVVITNLIDSYDRLIAFGQKHLNDLFVLDGIVNVNARDRILREIVSNTLAHRDYSSGFPAKMIIDDEKITIENSNLAHGIGALDLQKFEPFPKNPAISKVFREIGLADELGSGMRNTYKYTRLYSGAFPLFEEGNIFRTIIPLKKIATQKVGGNGVAQDVAHSVAQDVAHSVAQDVAHDKIALVEFIKEKIRENDKITRKTIADEAGVSVKTIERTIKEMDNLQYVGSGSNGHWELNE
ncbi:TPA: putative DNA binding domain-containing protein [Streptococcus agalactiae]|nr:helix-turn-helix domain-containing protein [Streptococcus agalactiae]KLJ53148.1 ATP-dependent DNA helicase RecG [Streptococcus agalactiae]KLK01304.1 ATP-dependent DNA helicase RecG [Streptococcus agalactiae]KLK02794.1 ATP-dependent DNA helicase RecG [Streptococcus agalactiae]KLK14177.1 ATP-dependent DNA helicase RecG [Streptococcus agalactiae]KLK47605.1 ATP-dependent DNA helicase RecG [Streptococcus agalactiae]